MQKSHIPYLSIFFVALIGLFSGCKKDKTDGSKKPFFSRMKDKQTNKTAESADQTISAFDLDDTDMKSFALENKLPAHDATSTAPEQPTKNNLFSWEQVGAEDSKNEFKKLFFEFDSYFLKPTQLANLKYDIKQAKKAIKEGKTLVIEGHACHSAGSAAYNLALSEKRARHVASEFAKAGIDSKNIKIAARGQEMPIRKGGNKEEQAVNRRVEIFAIS